MEKGFGDVSLFAFIPKSYKEKLSCVVEFRKYNIEGAIISIDQEKLLKEWENWVNRKFQMMCTKKY